MKKFQFTYIPLAFDWQVVRIRIAISVWMPSIKNYIASAVPVNLNIRELIINSVTHLINFMICVFSFMACAELTSSHVHFILRACIMCTLCVSNYIVYNMTCIFHLQYVCI